MLCDLLFGPLSGGPHGKGRFWEKWGTIAKKSTCQSVPANIYADTGLDTHLSVSLQTHMQTQSPRSIREVCSH